MAVAANKKGFILFVAYFVVVILSALAGAITARSVSEARVAEASRNAALAFHIAEGGVERGYRWLSDQVTPPQGTTAFDPFGANQPLGEGGYTVTIDPADSNPTSYVKRYSISGQGNASAAAKRITAVVQSAPFSRYGYFSNSETTTAGTRVWFITGDRLEGPVHTNGQFNIYGNPVFLDEVTSSSSSINYMRGGPPADNPRFGAGYQLGVESVPLPANLQPLRGVAASDGLVLNGSSTVLLRSDGTMDVTNQQRGWTNRNMPLPPNGVLYVEGGGLNISGTLNGQLTAASDQDIMITNNIAYSRNPLTDPTSTDVLGLASQRNVSISSNAPYNMTLQASVMALGNSFGVQNYQVGPPKGTLSLYGGIIQRNRGPVGTFNSSTGQRVSGYQKDYHYDARFRGALSPPYFPVIATASGYRYITISWTEEQ